MDYCFEQMANDFILFCCSHCCSAMRTLGEEGIVSQDLNLRENIYQFGYNP